MVGVYRQQYITEESYLTKQKVVIEGDVCE